jgi:phosphatidylglycerol:prolipoprotein diacylglycerol transferase
MLQYPDINPVALSIGVLQIHWYGLSYLLGISLVWLNISFQTRKNESHWDSESISDIVFYAVAGVLVGGRLGYIFFYNSDQFLLDPIIIFKIWEGGMSFHGALIGIVIGTYLFSKKNNSQTFFLLDIVACVAPIGIFFGRIANFINGELIGKETDVYWGVIFPKIDNLVRHPSQLYEAFLEGFVLFLVINFIYLRRNYKIGNCSSFFLIFYGIFRIFAELFREPDIHIGYLFGSISMGMLLSMFMIIFGAIIFFKRYEK